MMKILPGGKTSSPPPPPEIPVPRLRPIAMTFPCIWRRNTGEYWVYESEQDATGHGPFETREEATAMLEFLR